MDEQVIKQVIDELLKVCAACGLQAYRNCLVGNAAPAVRDYFQRVTSPRPGDMVLEISNRSAPPIDRIGRLISVGMENPPPEVLSEEDYDEEEWGRPYPPYQEKWNIQEEQRIKRMVWRIRTLDGRECRWQNANFIVIPDGITEV
jgi:hypothetical protein